jgi:hypothetical protein
VREQRRGGLGERKRFAEAEKERARRALRAVASDPAADFAGMTADDFFDGLKLARAEAIVNPSLIADTGRRIIAGQAGPRELHQVLFPEAEGEAWAAARGLAMAALARAPHDAVTVIGMEAQRLGGPGMTVTESATADGFTARVALDRGGENRENRESGGCVEGDTIIDKGKKKARQGAALSLLSVLTGLEIPRPAPGVQAAPPENDQPGNDGPRPR